MDVIKDHMVVDIKLQRAIIAQVEAAELGDDPARAVHRLGTILLPGGERLVLHSRHAADAILLDDFGQVVLITRTHNPGAGLMALPGGFLDDVDGGVETSPAAAAREAVEETSIDEALLKMLDARPVGGRRYDRPFDIREAWNNVPGTEIKKGELFAVSTRGFYFRLTGNLGDISLAAGDDAQAVQVLRVAELKPEMFAVPDHLDMIRAAMARTA